MLSFEILWSFDVSYYVVFFLTDRHPSDIWRTLLMQTFLNIKNKNVEK